MEPAPSFVERSADMVRLCATLPFRPDVRATLFYDNAARLLKLA